MGEAPMYYVQNSHPAIISRETFHMAQVEIARRKALQPSVEKKASTAVGKYSRYALSEVLVCGECGSRYKSDFSQRKLRHIHPSSFFPETTWAWKMKFYWSVEDIQCS